jgi:outer membrane phospholipase A
LAPEFWVYIGAATPPDLNRYRGNGQLRLSVGKGDGASLMLTVLPGEHFEHGSRQLDLTIPVRLPLFHFGTFILVQYFNGYAESLVSYNQRTDALRAGIQFVR